MDRSSPLSSRLSIHIEWHPSQRNDMRTFIRDWREKRVAHGDDPVLDHHPGQTLAKTILPYLAKDLIFELILSDINSNAPRDRITREQIFAKLDAARGKRRDLQTGREYDFGPELDAMSHLMHSVIQNQRKNLERFSRAAAPPAPRHATSQWFPTPA